MKRVNLNAVILVLILLGAVLFKSRFRSAEEPSLKTNNVTGSVPIEEQKVSQSLQSIQSSGLDGRAPASATATKATVVKAVVKLKAHSLPYAKELDTYVVLKKKVFLTETEERSRDQLLKNPAILRAMGQRLTISAADDAAALEQNSAVDMLLEALRSGDSTVATEVLKAVVTDRQVEDGALDISSRENLAGIKAEVLYQWSALNPVQSGQIASWLPGPVSQRIWQNVVTAQASNIAESADAD